LTPLPLRLAPKPEECHEASSDPDDDVAALTEALALRFERHLLAVDYAHDAVSSYLFFFRRLLHATRPCGADRGNDIGKPQHLKSIIRA
jgi:hypothetical protein